MFINKHCLCFVFVITNNIVSLHHDNDTKIRNLQIRCNSINILNHTIMSTKNFLHEVMSLAWRFVRKNGFTMSEALKCAWANMKLKLQMKSKIVKFYFQKVDGSVREAYGTLNEKLMPTITGTDNRKKNDTVQTYFDTERQEFRCYKKANLLKIA